MKMKRSVKSERIESMSEKLASAKGVYLADFTGLTVEKASLLRREMRKSGIHVQVIKNTLLRRAMQDNASYKELLPHLHGPTAVLLPTTEEIAPARILEAFIKEHKLPAVKLACIDGKIYGEEEVKQLAKLPPRDVLLGMLLRALQGPLSQFVSVLNAPLRDMANVLDQVSTQKGA
jgi:large subunit ribosomal protein L10